MTNLKIILLLVCLPLLGSLNAEASINPTDNVFVKIEAIDPAGKSILASEDKLYLKVNYVY